MTTRSFLFAATIVGVLTACGGDGGSGGTNPAPPPPASAGPSPTCTGAEAFSAVADATIVVGKPAGAVIAGCAGPLTDIQWTQTAGPAVTLMSAKTQASLTEQYERAVAQGKMVVFVRDNDNEKDGKMDDEAA